MREVGGEKPVKLEKELSFSNEYICFIIVHIQMCFTVFHDASL